jgi:Mn2+/Fe2+ NRAMP family transporter
MIDWKKIASSPLIAAAFLMATSAIGPGFLTQTAVFTDRLGASFAFVILVSIVLDIGVQVNIWRILAVSEMRAQDLANKVLPGAGFILSALIVIGGLAFNVGNLAGTGLGLQVLTGMRTETGALLSACVAIAIFLVRDGLKWMDGLAKVLGIVMMVLTGYVVLSAHPPLGLALQRAVMPETLDAQSIITLVGGTVGGYICFAGGHRLLDSGVKGLAMLPRVDRSAVTGISLAAVMRVLLFLAALGVVSKGLVLQQNNPAASVFQLAAGHTGYLLFGMVMWCAAITSVTGSAYTSVSFLKTFHPALPKYEKWMIVAFIAVSALTYVAIGQPVKVLVLVGALNGFILPLALGLMLWAAHRKGILKGYVHPRWLTLFGVAVILALLTVSFVTLRKGLW